MWVDYSCFHTPQCSLSGDTVSSASKIFSESDHLSPSPPLLPSLVIWPFVYNCFHSCPPCSLFSTKLIEKSMSDHVTPLLSTLQCITSSPELNLSSLTWPTRPYIILPRANFLTLSLPSGPLLTMLNLQWPPGSPWNTQNLLLPQCTCCSLCHNSSISWLTPLLTVISSQMLPYHRRLLSTQSNTAPFALSFLCSFSVLFSTWWHQHIMFFYLLPLSEMQERLLLCLQNLEQW